MIKKPWRVKMSSKVVRYAVEFDETADEFLTRMRGYMESETYGNLRGQFLKRYEGLAAAFDYTFELTAWIVVNEPEIGLAISPYGDLDDEYYDDVMDLFDEVMPEFEVLAVEYFDTIVALNSGLWTLTGIDYYKDAVVKAMELKFKDIKGYEFVA